MDGEHVASGGFRIDLRAALEKLKAHHNPAAGPILFLVRCAAAGGASFVRIRREARSCEVAFDGRPLSKRLLANPLASLFAEEGSGDLQEKFFAQATLHAHRPSLTAWSAASGAGAERWRSTTREDGSTAIEPESEGSPWTTIMLHLGSDDGGILGHPGGEGPRDWLWPPFPVTYSGEGGDWKVAARAAGADALAFRDRGVYGELAPDWERPAATLRLFHYGVLAGAMSAPAGPGLSGSLDDPQLPLDLSGAAVRGERIEELRALAAGQVRALAKRLAEGQEARLEALHGRAKGVDGLADFWEALGRREPKLMARLLEDARPSFWTFSRWARAPIENLHAAAASLLPVFWLRDMLARSLREGDRELAAELLDAPLYLGLDGGRLSVARLRKAGRIRPVWRPGVFGFEDAENVILPSWNEVRELRELLGSDSLIVG